MKEEKIIKKEMWENYTNKSDLMRLLGENNEKIYFVGWLKNWLTTLLMRIGRLKLI